MDYFPDELLNPHDLIDKDDIKQEMALARLEGIPNPSPFVILMRLRNTMSDVEELFGEWLPQSAEEINPAPPVLEADDYHALYSFLFSQDINEETVQRFMDNPTDDEALSALLQELYRAKVIKKSDWNKTLPKPKSVAQFILETIEKHGTITQRELFQIVSGIHSAARPTQTVRVSVRRLLARGLIKEVEPRVYTINN